MRVLIVANNSGGLTNFRGKLLSELVKKFDVIALTPIDDRLPELEGLGVQVIELQLDRRSTNPFREFLLLRRMSAHIKRLNPDYVITYTVKPNLYAGLICSWHRIPYASNITGRGTAFERGLLIKYLVAFLYKLALKNARVVFFENTSDRDYFVDNHIIKKQQSVVLQGAGVDIEKFNYQEYPIDTNPIRFLFIGRVMKEKGIDELLTAFQKLIADGYDVKLHILGRYEEDYQNTFDECISKGWLSYHGVKDDVRPYIAMSHCFVLPSWHEGMANTNLENAASGRPVITTNIPGCREAVIDGKSGFLCNKKDPEDLYNTLVRFINLPYDEKIKMGKLGREHMIKQFNKSDVVQMTINNLFK